MTDWADLLREFLKQKGQNGEWTCVNPSWEKVRWPYRVSQNYLRDPARRGQSLVWTELRDDTTRLETDYVQTSKTNVNCYCYARAMSDKEADVRDAVVRATNMRDQIATLVKLYTTNFAPAYRAMPNGMRPFVSWEITPGFCAVVLVVEFEHDENAIGVV